MSLPIARRRGSPARSVGLRGSHSGQRGQSIAEFALIVPILLIMLLAIVDLARLYTTMLTVESAAREAADFGAFHWYHWQDAASTADTAAKMEQRACIASMNLPDFTGNTTTCANPGFSYSLDEPPSNPSADCSQEPSPPADPCRVSVTLTYTFKLLAPLSIDFFGVKLGLPDTLTFSRDSTFAVSAFGIDPNP